MMNRRTMLAAAPFAAVTVGPVAAQTSGGPATSPGSSAQAPGFYRYKVGEIEVTAINDGFAQRPLEGFIRNAELADVKKAMAEAFLPENALPITFTGLVLRTAGKLIVIDTGNGELGPPTGGNFQANFKAAGFDPAQVDTVIVSHFHGDHINGIRRKDGSAIFPNAEIVVPEAEWAFWMDDAKAAQAGDALKATFAGARRVFSPIAKDVRRIEAGREVVPGVTAVAAYGHTPGHTAYLITSGSSRLMFLGDVTNHPALFVRHPEWAAVFDVDPDTARQTRLKMLEMAASERLQVAFFHAPFPATGHILKAQDGYRFVPVQWMPTI